MARNGGTCRLSLRRAERPLYGGGWSTQRPSSTPHPVEFGLVAATCANSGNRAAAPRWASESHRAAPEIISGSRAGMVGIYQRQIGQRKKRAALDAWSAQPKSHSCNSEAETTAILMPVCELQPRELSGRKSCDDRSVRPLRGFAEINRIRALCDQRSGLELECSHTG